MVMKKAQRENNLSSSALEVLQFLSAYTHTQSTFRATANCRRQGNMAQLCDLENKETVLITAGCHPCWVTYWGKAMFSDLLSYLFPFSFGAQFRLLVSFISSPPVFHRKSIICASVIYMFYEWKLYQISLEDIVFLLPMIRKIIILLIYYNIMHNYIIIMIRVWNFFCDIEYIETDFENTAGFCSLPEMRLVSARGWLGNNAWKTTFQTV